MLRVASHSTDPVDSLVRESLHALDEEGKIPPRAGFRRLIKYGLIDKKGRLDRSHVQITTLGELSKKKWKIASKPVILDTNLIVECATSRSRKSRGR
jgi:hypothetical protein